MRLAACLIVRDEAAHLPRCLASVRDYVDDVVVLDTGSNDGSPDLARAHGARVFHAPWPHDFAAARNQALARCDADAVLWIDADEALEALHPRVLRDALNQTDVGGWTVPIHNLTGPAHRPDVVVHHTVRLFRYAEGVAFEGRIHEQIAPAILRSGQALAPLPGVQIRHWGYLDLATDPLGKLERNLGLLQAELNARPEDPWTWFHLAGVYEGLGRDVEAEFAAHRAVVLGDDPGLVGSAGVLLIQARLRLGQPLAALDGAVRLPEPARGLLARFGEATALLRLGRPAEGLAALATGREQGWDPAIAGDYGVLTFKSDVLEAQLRMAAGDPRSALGPLARALAERPEDPDAMFTHGVALAVLGQGDLAARELERLGDDPRLGAAALHLAAQAHFDAGRYAACAGLMERLWDRGECRDDRFVLWTAALERLGNPRAVAGAFEAYAAVEPAPLTRLREWTRASLAVGDLPRALGYAVEALQRAPEDADAHFAAAGVLQAMGQLADAAHLYEAGLRLAPAHATAWSRLAECLAGLGLEAAASTARGLGHRPDARAAA